MRRLHVPHKVVYAVLALALVGLITVAGFAGSYIRMVAKVSNFNALRAEIETLRQRYQSLQHETSQKNEQLATLQLFATEVSMAYGIKRQIQGPQSVVAEGMRVPSFDESLEEFNFLKNTNFSIFSRKYPRLWQKDTKPSLWPVNGRLGSYFGKRTDPLNGMGAFHPGVDIPAHKGEPVRAAGDGIVTRARRAGGYGNLVVIEHGSGITTYYGHLSKIEVIAGQEVRRGQIVGAVGSTGRVTGNHLHYEVRQGGSPVNPYIFLKQSARPARYAKRDFPF
ncbi:MAG: M23 family metallopeptidase [bacterium]|nr:M23 family metallopeptidase [bacterium]